MFSPETMEFLEENGYEVKVLDNFIAFKHSSGRIFITLVTILCIPGSLLFFVIAPLYLGIPLVGLVLALGIFYFTKSHSKSGLLIPLNGSCLIFTMGNKELHKELFRDIEEIMWASTFIAEYASPFKSTSTEYAHSITIRTSVSKDILLFKFKGDYEQPGAPFMEIYNWLKELIKKGKEV